MADAYKCQDCGEVVAQLGSCPSCGGNSMRPTRVPESEVSSNEGAGNEETEAGDDAAATESDGSDQPGADDATPTDDTDEWEPSGGESTAGDSDDTTAGSRERRKSRGARTDNHDARGGGLLAWLKSLF